MNSHLDNPVHFEEQEPKRMGYLQQQYTSTEGAYVVSERCLDNDFLAVLTLIGLQIEQGMRVEKFS